jgi:tetratricopeptide (TPR) repeat protein
MADLNMGDEELDRQIDARRAQLLAAIAGSSAEAELTCELTALLAERYQRRMAAGDQVAALDDLEESVSRLDAVMARQVPDSSWFACLAWSAGLARAERWALLEDPADRDAAIGYLSALAATLGEVDPAVCATLARLYAGRAYDREPGAEQDADLEAAIRDAQSGLASLPLADPAPADGGIADAGTATELRLVLGLALSERFGAERRRLDPGAASNVSAARASLDEAIATLGTVVEDIELDESARAAAADALGRALHDRYSDSWPGAAQPDPADLDRAIELLSTAVSTEPDPRAIAYLAFAYSDRFDLCHDSQDLDHLITSCQRYLDLESPAAEDFLIRQLLSSALLDRADANPDTRRTDLDAAIGHLEAELAATPPEDPDRAFLLSSLADACWQRLDGDASSYDRVDQMTSYAEQAWPALGDDDEQRALIGLYLAVGRHEQFRRPGAVLDMAAASRAIDVLYEVEPLLADDPSLHLMVVVTLGHFLVGRGQVTGMAADLKAAMPWLMQAAAEVPADDPEWAEITQTLVVSMSTLANLDMDVGHLDEAIGLLERVSGRTDPDAARAAMTRGVLGTLLIQRAWFTASGDDLNEGIAHLVESYGLSPAGHPYRVAAGLNLAAALLTRFLELGQAEDVDAARFYLNMADTLAGPTGDEVRSLMADVDMNIASNRGLLGIADGMRGDAGALDEAVMNLRRALAMVPSSHPHHSRLRSDLGLALALRGMSGTGSTADAIEAGRELSTALAALPGGHMMRPLALLRTGGVLAGAGVVTGNERLLREAIGYLDTALGELDPRFGGRFRFAALLGMAAVALNRRSHDPADLDRAITWLEQARGDLDGHPAHPQYANCLSNLAQAYRARGDAGPAHAAGFAALRGRARDLMVQSGTARSLGFARAAAEEAARVAAWCLQDADAGAAVEALEMGRGLILYAATSVAGLPDLLAAAGHGELARSWQDAAAAGSEPPWDAGTAAAANLPGLLDGTTGLNVPDDLRARVFAALAGSAVEQRLLAPPSLPDLAAALGETGADAIVYLLGATDERPGCAVIVPAVDLADAARPEEIQLPLVRGDADAVVQTYAGAYAEMETDPGRFRQALGDLCDWAWHAVMGPILDLARSWSLGRPPRLVLIPAGILSLVPWHAARPPSAGSGAVRFAISEAVISYAASGRQLLDVARRFPLPLTASPVIVVADPTQALPGAPLEARAIFERCYPAGRYLGWTEPGWDRPPDGPGTPGEVLGQLPAIGSSGASMLHLGCHGMVVGSAPGRSHLVLAEHEELRVDAILQQARGRPVTAAGGLVTLAACGSDLAIGEYEEALTPATAFLAAGAVTVVGARWQLLDAATSLLMFMFHHYLTGHSQPPRDALRLAQLWMLDRGRKAPPEMPVELARHASRATWADLTVWAGFVHQGR